MNSKYTFINSFSIFLIISFFISNDLFALERELTNNLEIIKSGTNEIVSVKILENGNYISKSLELKDISNNIQNFLKEKSDVLKINPKEFFVSSIRQDNYGFVLVDLDQSISSIPVYANSIKFKVGMDGKLLSANFAITDIKPNTLTPTLTITQSEENATNYWYANYGSLYSPSIGNTELVVLPKHLTINQNLEDVLCYKVNIFLGNKDNHFIDDTYFINATNGLLEAKITENQNLSRNVYDCGDDNPYDTSCRLNWYSFAWNYYFGRSEGQPVRGPSMAPEFYGSTNTDVVYDNLGSIHAYWLNNMNLDGANNQGGIGWGSTLTQTRSFIHPDLIAGAGCPNAWFNSTSRTLNFCNDFVHPETIGHEYTHAVIHHKFHDINGTPIGAVYLGETAALNEGTCDFFGQAYQQWSTGTTDWVYGETAPYTYPRSLINPNSTINPTSNLPHPDRTFESNLYCGQDDSGGAHVNMTVFGHALYSLAEGGYRNGVTVAPIGISNVQNILYRAWDIVPSSVTFIGMYEAMNQACDELIGEEDPICLEVKKALEAVELNQIGICISTEEHRTVSQFAGKIITSKDLRGFPKVYFNRNEYIYFSTSEWAEDYSLNVLVAPHVPNRREESNIPAITTRHFSTDDSGSISLNRLTRLSSDGAYDIIVDSNRNGTWESAYDKAITIRVISTSNRSN